jgi:hypothetical protein
MASFIAAQGLESAKHSAWRVGRDDGDQVAAGGSQSANGLGQTVRRSRASGLTATPSSVAPCFRLYLAHSICKRHDKPRGMIAEMFFWGKAEGRNRSKTGFIAPLARPENIMNSAPWRRKNPVFNLFLKI